MKENKKMKKVAIATEKKSENYIIINSKTKGEK